MNTPEIPKEILKSITVVLEFNQKYNEISSSKLSPQKQLELIKPLEKEVDNAIITYRNELEKVGPEVINEIIKYIEEKRGQMGTLKDFYLYHLKSNAIDEFLKRPVVEKQKDNIL
ncbi:MAG: hypothetical protein FWE47_01850 [Oscillospiraceae bacterium]|nr:hypothetical protein [Oscillospiraceae bacterium]